MENYIAIKERVFQGPGQGSGVAVFNPAEPAIRYMKFGQRQAHRFMMTPPQPGDFGVRKNNGKDWIARGGQALMPTHELSLPGRHNLANALAALAIGEAIGLGLQPMLDTLHSFPGLAHRTQLVATFGGIRWINDSKGTNVGATVAAVSGLDGPLILILGGEGKGQDFRPLVKALKGKVRNIVLMGKDARTIGNDLQGTVPKVTVPGMAEAVLEARSMAQRGDTVLLSPACASQDQYRDYRRRGDDFTARVEALKLRHAGDGQ
jgi:UDP-N-acetylmuramoylalanine--D-glutamate ligase